MNSKSNQSTFAAALKIIKAVADDRNIILNEVALNYAARRFHKLRAQHQSLASDDVVYAALKGFPESPEGKAYWRVLVEHFLKSYSDSAGKRLGWASAEGFIPADSVPELLKAIVTSRIACFAETKSLDLGVPWLTTPSAVGRQASEFAMQDVNDNLGEFSKVTHLQPGDILEIATALKIRRAA